VSGAGCIPSFNWASLRQSIQVAPNGHRAQNRAQSRQAHDATGDRQFAGRLASLNVKVTVTVMMTGVGMLFTKVGVYSHCRTASIAA
jgi:hypothetical protein